MGSLAYIEEKGIDTREVRLAGVDFVGNLIDFVYGPERRTFYDDRFDMFPADVTEAHMAVVTGAPTMRSELDAFDIDLVAVLELLGDGSGAHGRSSVASALRRRSLGDALPPRSRPRRDGRHLLICTG